jgi:hypothetical protein
MGSGLIEIDNILVEKPRELLLMEDQEMIQACSPHASQKAFAESICLARVRYGVRSTLMPLVVATRAKLGSHLRSLSRIRYLGPSPNGVASLNCCATQGSVGARVTFTWIRLARFQFDDEEGKKRTEEEVRDLQEIAGPYFCRMIAQERFPVLSTRPRSRERASYTSE